MTDVKQLPPTGERFLPEFQDETVAEHLHRYFLAQEICVGKNVLDVASGEGYGSNLLAQVADSVVGVDISPDAANHAAKKYLRTNLQFHVGSASALPIESHSLDVAISFETIEHHHEHEQMIRELRRVLKPDGVLMISTPDRLHYTDNRGIVNEFHVHELYRDEFESLLGRHFEHVELLTQQTLFGSVIAPARYSSGLDYITGDFVGFERSSGLRSPLYNICLASSAPLPQFRTSIFVSSLERSYAMQDKLDRIRTLEQRLGNLSATIDNLQRSSSFKIGRLITAPIRWISR